MKLRAEFLYLDLMKKTLSFILWPEPPLPITTSFRKRSPIRRAIALGVAGMLQKRRLQIGKTPNYSESERVDGKVWSSYADTMIGLKRLDNLQHCIESVLSENVEGDLIETGVWRGGACIFMRAALAAYGIEDRKVFVADSFEGLPKPDAEKYPSDKDDVHHTYTFLAVSQEAVENNFRKYGLLDDQVVFLKGWFKDTLPRAPIDKLSILRLDGDMYSSTMDSLENLYPKLSVGGYCIIDDYCLPNCEAAVDDFRAKNSISSELKEIDWSGRYWRKEE